MNYGISVLFRAIPLLMALFCFGYGFFVFNYGVDSSRFVAGPVVFSLGFICIALFATAATIIRQIIHTYNNVARFALPILGYLSATITFLAGFILLMSSPAPADFVAGLPCSTNRTELSPTNTFARHACFPALEKSTWEV